MLLRYCLLLYHYALLIGSHQAVVLATVLPAATTCY